MRYPTLYSELEQLESELATLERKGVLIDVPLPRYGSVEEASNSRLRRLRVSGVATMHSGIIITYLRDLFLEMPPKGEALVIDEERSYSAILQGEDTIIRFDSGHTTHSPDPHQHQAWTTLTDIDSPTMPLASSLELGNFIGRIEEWRMDHLAWLPTYPASIENARWP